MNEPLQADVYLPDNIIGTFFETILRRMNNFTVGKEIEWHIYHLDSKATLEAIQGQTDSQVVLVLGVPLYNAQSVSGAVEANLGNPFTEFMHVATYGDTIDSPNLYSHVGTPLPLGDIVERLHTSSIVGEYLTMTDEIYRYMELLDGYMNWAWEGSDLEPDMHKMIALYEIYHQLLPSRLERDSLDNESMLNHQLIQETWRRLNQHIEKKVSQVYPFFVELDGEQVVGISVWEDQQENLVASRILQLYNNYEKRFVLLVKPGKKCTVFSIRTKGIDVERITRYFRGGGHGETGFGISNVDYNSVIGSTFVQLVQENKEKG